MNTLTAISGQEPIELRQQYCTAKEIAKYFHTNNIISDQIKSVDLDSIPEEKLSYLEKIYLDYRDLINSISPLEKLDEKPQNLKIEWDIKLIRTKKI